MKSTFTNSTKLFTLFLLSIFSFPSIILAQTIGPGIAPVNSPTGGINIDGSLLANSNTGDWVDGTGTGGYILANSGIPLNLATTYHLYDPYGNSTDNIFGGGNKVDDNPNSWSWVSGTANNKTDMNNALIHFTTDTNGNVWVVFAADRLSNSGNSYVDFEFLQTAMTKTGSGFSTSAPASTGGRTVNDFLLTVYFQNGVAKFDIQKWELNGSVWEYKTYFTSLPLNSVYAAGNTTNVPVPFQAFGANNYPQNTFIESAVNLTAVLGSIDPCASLKIKTVFVKSKTSNSPSAAITDFFDPIAIDNLTLGSADAGHDDNVCYGSPYMLHGIAIASPGYQIISKNWSFVAGSGTITDPTDLNSNVSINGSSATLRLTVVTGPIAGVGSQCAVSDDVVITVKQPTTCLITGPDGPLCPSSSTIYSAPVCATYAWSIVGNGTIVGNSNSSTVSVTAGSSCSETFTLSLTITAANGCISTCTKTVNVVDDIKPTVTKSSIGTCYASVALAEAAAKAATTSSDNCIGTLTTAASTAGDCAAVITVKVTDGCGNFDEVTYNTRIDNTKPTVSKGLINTCYASIALAEAAATAATTSSDNCVGALTTVASTAGDYAAVITVKVTDGCGNSDEVTYNTRIDNTKPTIIKGSIGTCYASVALAEVAATAATTSSDNCIGTLTTAVSTVGDCAAIITVKVIDGCGNYDEITYNTRIDNTKPTVTKGSIGTCYASVAIAEAAATAATTSSDNCIGTLTTVASTAGDCAAVITIKVTDDCGNFDEVTYNTRIDNTKPTVTKGSINTCYASVALAEAAAKAATTSSDNCIGTLTTAASTAGDCAAIITIKVTDGCGNYDEVTYNTRIDNIKPTVIKGYIGTCYASVALAEAAAKAATTSSDNCVGALTTVASTAGDYAAVITVKVTDGCGNYDEVTYNTRIDNTKPTVIKGSIGTCYASVALAEAAAKAATTFSDNCIGTLTTAVITAGDCSAVITVKVTDGCGNSDEVTYNTRIDNTKPTVTKGSIGTCYASVALAEAAAKAATTSSDNCIGTLTTAASTVGDCAAVITIKVTDGCGNYDEVMYNTRIDNTKPTVTKGSIGTCYASVALAEAAAKAATTSSDNCIGTLTTAASTAGDCAAIITVKVTDSCGNYDEITYNTRIDNTKPSVTKGSIGTCYASVTLAEAAAKSATTSSDNCVGTLTTVANTAGDCAAIITVKVTDGCGNYDEVTYNTRIDDTKPILNVPSDITVECSLLPSDATAATATASDNCDLTPLVTYLGEVKTNGGCPNNYTLTRTWKAEDTCGNFTTKSQTIEVQDTTVPTFTPPKTLIILESDKNCEADYSITGPAGTITDLKDKCDPHPTATAEDDSCFGTEPEQNVNARGDYFSFTVAGFDNLTAKDIRKISLTFETNQGKGRAEFTLIAPNGDKIILVGPYCVEGNCNDNSPATKEVYEPTFYPCSSPYQKYDNNTNFAPGPGNFIPWGATIGQLGGIYASCFDQLTGPMNGEWKIFSRKQQSSNGEIKFKKVCLTPDEGSCTNNKVIVRHWTVSDACSNTVKFDQVIRIIDKMVPTLTGTPYKGTSDSNSCKVDAVTTAPFSATNAILGYTDNCGGAVTATLTNTEVAGSDCAWTITYTFDVKDGCNNSLIGQKYSNTGRDKTAPTLTGTPYAGTINSNSCKVNALITVPFNETNAILGYTDNCGGAVTATVTNTEITGTDCAWTVTYTFDVKDGCNNTLSGQKYSNSGGDKTAPTLTGAPYAGTKDSNSCKVDAVTSSPFSATNAILGYSDNCSGQVTATLTNTEVTSTVCAWIVTYTFDVSDGCGNILTDQKYSNSGGDKTAPTGTAPANLTGLQCKAEIPTANILDVTDEADNCLGEVTVTVADTNNEGSGCKGSPFIVNRTYTLTDCGGNETKLVQTITVEDTTAPAGTAPANLTGLQCKAEIPTANILDLTDEADNCLGEVTVKVADTNNKGSGCKGSPYIVNRTYTLTDCGGNETKLVQTITVEDTTAPSGTAPKNISGLQCKAEIPTANILDVTDEADNCLGEVTVTVADTNNEVSGCKGSPYIVTRTYTLKDCGGNETKLVQTITVEDTTAPAGIAPKNISGLQCKAEIPTVNILDVTDESDNCFGEVTVKVADTNNEGSGCKGSPYIVTRTYTLTDCGGNETKLVQTITVEDTTAPTGTAPKNISGLQCKAEIPTVNILDVTDEADNCLGEVTVTVADTNNEGSGCKGSPYIIKRTYTLTDCGGNETKLVQTITVEDTTAPTGTAPANLTGLQCKAEIPTANIQDVTTEADNCLGEVTVKVTDTNNEGSGCKGSPYIVTRTYTLTDCGGNETKLVQTITVEDTTAPTGIAPANLTGLQCKAEIPIANIQDVTTEADNCLGEVTVKVADTNNEGSGCKGSPYIVTRTYTLTDCGGNETKLVQTITVEDTTAPIGTAPKNISGLQCKAEIPPANILDVTTESNNCLGEVIITVADTNNEGSGCKGSPYIVTRTYTLTDCGGNETKLVQTITVQDTTSPIGTAPKNISGLQCKAEIPTVNILDVTDESDNCLGEVTVTVTVADTNNEGSGCKGSPYIVTRTFTLTDCGGNETKLVQTITVEDTTAPIGTAPKNISGLQCKAEIPTVNILDVTDESDNCLGEVTVKVTDTNNEGSGCKGSPYIVTRTYTLIDCGGNETKLVQTITVEDTTAPTGTAPANLTGLQCKAEIPTANILDVTTETGNCLGEVTVKVADTNNEGSGCKGSPYIVTRTYTLIDCGGNETKLVQTITVEDTTGPTGTAPANITGLQCKAGIPTANILDVTTEADNCLGEVTVKVADTNNEGSGCKGSPYIVTRTYTLTDCGGNETKLVQTITVEDTTGPIGTAPANITGLQCKAGIPTANILDVSTEADNCLGEVTVKVADTNNDGSGCKGSPYIVTRTYTLADCGGNETKLVQTITVEDTTGPTTKTEFSATIDVSCDAIPPLPALVFTDNCSTATLLRKTEDKINVTQNSYSIVRKWFVTDTCNNESVFTQIINVSVENSIVTIPSSACNNGEVTTVSLLSLLPAGTPSNGTWTDVSNSGALQGEVLTVFGLAITAANNPPYAFEYKINDANCPRSIIINMTINDTCGGIVLPCGTVLVHNAFSPNGDGINENFIIDNIDLTDCFPTNTVEIYNRWGVLVFETTGYNNTTRVFNGISQGRTTISQSSGLPTGTYFYILNYTSKDNNGNLQTNKKDGYLYLTR